MYLKSIPNLISIIRIILIIPVLLLIYDESYDLALFLFLLAGLSDALDGYFARRFKAKTDFGKYIDPLADKILVLSAFFILHNLYPNYIPLWMVFSIFMRDAIVTVFRLYLNYRNSVLKTSVLAKRKTLFHSSNNLF